LPYASQRESPGDRSMSRADRIRRRLGWKAGIARPMGLKPKGMHWCTFYRLQLRYIRFAQTSLSETCRQLGISIP
jgi:hypothetical protein